MIELVFFCALFFIKPHLINEPVNLFGNEIPHIVTL